MPGPPKIGGLSGGPVGAGSEQAGRRAKVSSRSVIEYRRRAAPRVAQPYCNLTYRVGDAVVFSLSIEGSDLDGTGGSRSCFSIRRPPEQLVGE